MKHKFTMLVAGPSKYGKKEFVEQLIQTTRWISPQRKKLDRSAYLYKQLLISYRWTPFIVRSKYQSFRRIRKAHFTIPPVQLDWTLLKGPWFQTPKICLYHFKNVLRKGYDVANCWGTTHYILMQHDLGDRRRWKTHPRFGNSGHFRWPKWPWSRRMTFCIVI
jgi:hypothetical protein